MAFSGPAENLASGIDMEPLAQRISSPVGHPPRGQAGRQDRLPQCLLHVNPLLRYFLACVHETGSGKSCTWKNAIESFNYAKGQPFWFVVGQCDLFKVRGDFILSIIGEIFLTLSGEIFLTNVG